MNTSPTTLALRGAWVPLSIILALLLTLHGIRYQLFNTSGGVSLFEHVDLEVYRLGAQAFLDGENIYTRDYDIFGIVNLPFTYPPIAAITFIPFTWFSAKVAGLLWVLLSVAMLWWCIAAVLRATALDQRSAGIVAAWILPIACALEPVTETFDFAQVNIFLMFLVLVDVLGRHRIPRGVLSGIAAAIKLTPAVFILYFLARRDYKGAATMVGSAVGVTLLAWIVAPKTSLDFWFHTLSSTDRIGAPWFASNQSIKGALYRIAPEAETANSVIWLIAVLAVIALAFLAMRRIEAPAGALAVNSLVALLCSPVSWSHHWVWFIPMALVGAVAFARSKQVLAFLLATLPPFFAFLGPHWMLPNRDNNELDWAFWQHLFGDAYVLVGIFVLLLAFFRPRVLDQRA